MAQATRKRAVRESGGDEPITLEAAAKILNVSRVTVWRWANEGRNGVQLAAVTSGRAQYTSRDAIRVFQAQAAQPNMETAKAELAAKVREMSHA